ncbi:MAG: hypothetical protein ACNS62_16580 [Candidatus Cyclobacteriaceae bacterium M3_2C_046]
MKNKWTTGFILSGIIIIIAAIAYKNAAAESFFAGISFLGLLYTYFKGILVTVIAVLSIPVLLITLLIDVILWLITVYDSFPLTGFVWGLVFHEITLDWFWLTAQRNELFLTGFLVILTGVLASNRRSLRFT